MENKKTSELLDLAYQLEKKCENGDDSACDKLYGELSDELQKRYPFSEIIGEKEEENAFTLQERLTSLEESFDGFQKKVKRHKHDEKSGDVMIRI